MKRLTADKLRYHTAYTEPVQVSCADIVASQPSSAVLSLTIHSSCHALAHAMETGTSL